MISKNYFVFLVGTYVNKDNILCIFARQTNNSLTDKFQPA